MSEKKATKLERGFLYGVFAVVGVALISQCNEKMENAPPDHKLISARECGKKFTRAARYDADICFSCTGVVKDGDFYLVDIRGKMQNAFGAWSKKRAICTYDSKDQTIKKFNLVNDR